MSSREHRLGVVAALGEELGPLERRLDGAERAKLGGVEVSLGRLGGRSVWIAAAGVGGERAGRNLGALLAAYETEALLGIGVAGGLSPGLEAGEIVWSREVRGPAGELRTPPPSEWLDRAASLGVRGGTLVAVEEVVSTAAAKAELASRLALEGPVAIDLESAAWVGGASAADRPWLILRAISDSLEEDLPLDFERFRSADGSVSRAKVAAHAALRPGLLVKLERLRRRVSACAESLADVVEELVA